MPDRHFSDQLVALNYVSLAAASAVILIFITVQYLKPELVNRVTFRLQTGSSVSDFVLHIISCYQLGQGSTGSCRTIGFFRYFTRQFYCFINISIALNLQLIFINEFEPSYMWEVGYWAISFALALILNLTPATMDSFKIIDNNCYIGSDDNQAIGFIWFNSLLPIFTFVYCLIVSVIVISRLRKDWSALAKSTFNQRNPSRKRLMWLQKELKSLAIRVVLYPIVAFIALSGFSVYQIEALNNTYDFNSELSLWASLGQDASGLLDFIAILFDPSLQFCLKSLWKEFRSGEFKIFRPQPKDFAVSKNFDYIEEPVLEEPEILTSPLPDNSARSSDESYHIVIYDDNECRQAVNLF